MSFKRFTSLILAMAVSGGLLAGGAAAAVWYVTPDGAGLADGSDWGNAFSNLQDAVTAAADDDAILLGPGTHGLTNQVIVDKGVLISGDQGATDTTLTRGATVHRLLYLDHTNAVVEHLTLKDGRTPGEGGEYIQGGGIYLREGLVRQCVFTNNSAVYGGGIYMTGGTVDDCTLINNPTLGGGGSSGQGGGIFMTGGAVTDSRITGSTSVRQGAGIRMTGGSVMRSLISGNAAGHGGGGVNMSGGRLENCIISGNIGGSWGGGGGGVLISGAGAEIVHCTIVENQTTGNGGGIHRSAGTIHNTIVFGNTLHTGQANDVAGDSAAFPYCLAIELTNAVLGQRSADPEFIAPGQALGGQHLPGDYRLRPGSPAINAGDPAAGITNDFVHAPRPADGAGSGTAAPDMGAYEAAAYDTGPLRVNVIADRVTVLEGEAVVLTAHVAGENHDPLEYTWDLDDDGLPDIAGLGRRVITNSFAPGRHTITLTVVNSWHQRATITRTDYLLVQPLITYVALDGAHRPPFHDWVHAATNLQAAVDQAGEGVRVAAGVYELHEPLQLNRRVFVESVDGPETTVLSGGGGNRIAGISHDEAVLRGFRIAGGYAGGQGGGILMSAGRIEQCVVVSNRAVYGAGIYMTGGTVYGCDLILNPTLGGGGGSGQGGGAYMTGGWIEQTRIASNTSVRQGSGLTMTGGGVNRCWFIGNSSSGASGGGGLYISGGFVRSSLFLRNQIAGPGGGILIAGSASEVANCTVTGNSTTGTGGGIYRSGGSIINTIITGNQAASDDDVSGDGFTYCLSPGLPHDPEGTGNRTNAPAFVVAGTGYGLSHVPGDYRLDHGAPAIDAGDRTVWMDTALDLDGHARVIKGRLHEAVSQPLWRPDIGAYEYVPPRRGGVVRIR